MEALFFFLKWRSIYHLLTESEVITEKSQCLWQLLLYIHSLYCERFEPGSHFKSRLSLIVPVYVVLNRTVVADSDWCLDNLCGSHLQSIHCIIYNLHHVTWKMYKANETTLSVYIFIIITPKSYCRQFWKAYKQRWRSLVNWFLWTWWRWVLIIVIIIVFSCNRMVEARFFLSTWVWISALVGNKMCVLVSKNIYY